MSTELHKMFDAQAVKVETCAADNCSRSISAGEPMFIDLLTSSIYCSMCGMQLRFHRKRALKRGAPMPTSFANVGEN